MSDLKYREALYQAINKSMLENKKYVGSIEKNKNGEYFVLKDAAQELAIVKFENMQKKSRVNKEKKGEER